MRFKDKDLIKPGDIFNYPCELPAIGAAGVKVSVKCVVVVEVHTHHILVMDIEEPHLKYTLQNFDLLLKGVVNRSDCILRENISGGTLKFNNRGI